MCAYLSKSEDESTEAMKQAAKEASENGKKENMLFWKIFVTHNF